MFNTFGHPTQIQLQNCREPHLEMGQHKQVARGWNPYDNNGGTVAAVGTEEGVIIVADTRLSRGYTCIARNESKIHNLGGENYMLSTGCHADVRNLWKRLDENATQYEFKMGRKLSLSATANLLSRTLYGARFFPYLAYNMLAGLDENGRGVVFNYDVVGSYESSNYFCGGTSQELIIPVLDTIFLAYHHKVKTIPKSLEQIEKMLLDAFQSATERDIQTGDGLEVIILRKGKEPEHKRHKLRKD